MARVNRAQEGYTYRNDWGATRTRMVSRYDMPVNFERRGRPTRESHAHHHQKSYRQAH